MSAPSLNDDGHFAGCYISGCAATRCSTARLLKIMGQQEKEEKMARSRYEEPTPCHTHVFVNGKCDCGDDWKDTTTMTTPTLSPLGALSGVTSLSDPLDQSTLLLAILEISISINAQLVQLNSSVASGRAEIKQGMKTMNDQVAAIDQELKDAAAAISARIQALIDAVTAAGQVTPEQLAALQADADALKAIGTPPTT